MPSYSGPIYFEAVPCSPSCNRYPSALASTSRFPACSHAAIASPRSSFSASLAEEQEEEDFEWARLGSGTKIDVVSTRVSRHTSSTSAGGSRIMVWPLFAHLFTQSPHSVRSIRVIHIPIRLSLDMITECTDNAAHLE